MAGLCTPQVHGRAGFLWGFISRTKCKVSKAKNPNLVSKSYKESQWSFSWSFYLSNFVVTPWTVAHQVSLSMGFSSKNTRVGCHFLLQRIFLTQGLIWGSFIGRRILYHWATSEAPNAATLKVKASTYDLGRDGMGRRIQSKALVNNNQKNLQSSNSFKK